MTNSDKDNLLARWLNKKNKPQEKHKLSEISKKPEGSAAVLSYGQQRLWFLQQLFPENPFYNYAEIYMLSGQLEVDYLIRGFEYITQRHSILQSTFHVEKEQAVQKRSEAATFDYRFVDLSLEIPEKQLQKAEAIAIASAKETFDIHTGPLTRIVLIKIDEHRHMLVIIMHHIITDKWSMRVLREELSQVYNALCNGQTPVLPPLPFQYEDYAYWQKSKDVDPKQIKYWKEKLAGSTPFLNLPTDHQKPDSPSFKGAFNTRVLNPELSEQLKKLSKQSNTTLFVLLLTAYKILLTRYSGEEDILVGTPITNRDQTALEKLIGFFNDTLVLRSDLGGDPRFIDLLNDVRGTVLEAFSNKDTPFETLVKTLKPDRYLSSNPLFQVMFLFHKVPENPSFGPDLTFEYSPFDFGVSKFDLTLYISEEKEHLSATIEYTTDLFDNSTIDRMHDHFRNLLEQIVSNPNQRISTLHLLSPEEKHRQIVEWNDTHIELPTVKGIHQFIEKYAHETPNAKAVSFQDTSYTYAELNEKADRIANKLRALGVGPNIPVGLCAERSLNMVVGILGILKSGGAYLPIDPEYPAERIDFMIQDAAVPFVLSQADQIKTFEGTSSTLLNLEQILQEPVNNIPLEANAVSSSDLAYIIYTSGSSGRPKGVPVSHENIIHSTFARFDYYPNQPGNFLLLSSFAFDSSMVGIFWTLCVGGNLVLTKKKVEQDMTGLGNLISKHKITHTLLLPSLYNLLLQSVEADQLNTLNTVMVAGEACTPGLCQQHFDTIPAADLFNEYGPTEASVWCTAHQLKPEDAKGSIPIGLPIANTSIYILDENFQPVPVGVAGELYVGGVGVTQGYINRPDLTNERFLKHPFNKEAGKIYKTGDLAKYRPDGIIDFLGRADHQVKVRGYRIELTEISDVLNKYPSVNEAIVFVKKEDTDKEQSYHTQRLVACFNAEQKIQQADLQKYMKAQLPEYMIPSAFIQLDEMPHLPNGKLDMNTLYAIEVKPQVADTSNYQAAQTPMEQKLVEIWETVLGFKPIGTHDNFFAIGGDSILSIQINGKARKEGIKLSPNQIFENQSIRELAASVKIEVEEPENIDLVPSGDVLLTPIQQWFFDTHKNAPHHWNQGIIFQVPTKINSDFVQQAFGLTIQRHDALRLSFSLIENQWKASILDSDKINSCKIIDVSTLTEADQNIKINQQVDDVNRSFKLSNGNLFVCLYFQCGDIQQDQLILIAHHLVVDNVSWQIITEGFETIINQLNKGERVALGPQSISYRQWSQTLKEVSKTDLIQSDYNYWKKLESDSLSQPVPVDFDHSLPVLEESIQYAHFELNVADTSTITKEISKNYGVRTNEILLTAYMLAMHSWNKTTSAIIEMEGHGREAVKTGLDFFNSVGWYTAVFPLEVHLNPTVAIGTNLKKIKDQIRSVPNKGLSYGILRYPNSEQDLMETLNHRPPVIFNYLGIQNHLQSEILGEGKSIIKSVRSPKSERHHMLEFNIVVIDQKLQVSCGYSQNLHKRTTIEEFMTSFKNAIHNLIEECHHADDHMYSSSDFPDANISLEDLDSLFDQL
jgi:amino acid adenylation domain-containing protein/non-ribosomal peptide synthase protein (TIGR01720 family)